MYPGLRDFQKSRVFRANLGFLVNRVFPAFLVFRVFRVFPEFRECPVNRVSPGSLAFQAIRVCPAFPECRVIPERPALPGQSAARPAALPALARSHNPPPPISAPRWPLSTLNSCPIS
jgi:hypothetical protein